MFQRALKIGFVSLLSLAAVGTIVQAQNAPVKNVVLVHGAWADGSGWRGVYDILIKDGIQRQPGARAGDVLPR